MLMSELFHFPVEATAEDAIKSLERSQGGDRYFGADRNGGARLHAGIDLGAPDGSWDWANRKVFSATDGIVKWVGSAGPNYGLMIAVAPTGNLPWPPGSVSEVRYVHLNRDIPVSAGQRIKAGQLLGTLYSAIWPHLHFQLGPGVPGHDLSACLDPYPIVKENAFNQPTPATEDDMARALQVFDTDRGFQILGGDNETDTSEAKIHFRKGDGADSLVKVWVYPIGKDAIRINEETLKDNQLRVVNIRQRGAFGVQVTHTGDAPFWAAGFQK